MTLKKQAYNHMRWNNIGNYWSCLFFCVIVILVEELIFCIRHIKRQVNN